MLQSLWAVLLPAALCSSQLKEKTGQSSAGPYVPLCTDHRGIRLSAPQSWNIQTRLVGWVFLFWEQRQHGPGHCLTSEFKCTSPKQEYVRYNTKDLRILKDGLICLQLCELSPCQCAAGLAWGFLQHTATAEKHQSAGGHLHLTILGAPRSCSHQQWEDWEVWELILSDRLLLPAGCWRFVTACQQSVCGGRVVSDL